MAWTTEKTWTVGEVLTAAGLNTYLRDDVGYLYAFRTDERAYLENAAPTTTANTTEATAATVIGPTASVTTDGSEKLLIEFWAPGYNTNQTASEAFLTLFEDTTPLGRAHLALINSTFMSSTIYMPRRRQPAAGTHTYTVKVHTASGSITILGGAGGTGVDLPVSLRVTRVGI